MHPFCTEPVAPPPMVGAVSDGESSLGLLAGGVLALGLIYWMGVRSGRTDGYVRGIQEGEHQAREMLAAHQMTHMPFGQPSPVQSPYSVYRRW